MSMLVMRGVVVAGIAGAGLVLASDEVEACSVPPVDTVQIVGGEVAVLPANFGIPLKISRSVDGDGVEVVIFDEAGEEVPSTLQVLNQRRGRGAPWMDCSPGVLEMREAVYLKPVESLVPGESYQVVVRAGVDTGTEGGPWSEEAFGFEAVEEQEVQALAGVEVVNAEVRVDTRAKSYECCSCSSCGGGACCASDDFRECWYTSDLRSPQVVGELGSVPNAGQVWVQVLNGEGDVASEGLASEFSQVNVLYSGEGAGVYCLQVHARHLLSGEEVRSEQVCATTDEGSIFGEVARDVERPGQCDSSEVPQEEVDAGEPDAQDEPEEEVDAGEPDAQDEDGEGGGCGVAGGGVGGVAWLLGALLALMGRRRQLGQMR
ncbi:hypothetical protein [Lujinxingia litoralis]|nr:hypothetical protein [Lujinxingia litoralis]